MAKFIASASISMSNINSSDEEVTFGSGSRRRIELREVESKLRLKNSISSLTLGHSNYFRAGLWANIKSLQ